MKKVVLVTLSLALLIVSVMAFADDYSSMTDEQLKQQFEAIRNELFARGLKAEEKTVIVDKDGFQIYINGEIKIGKQYDWDDEVKLFIPIVVVNDTTHNCNMMVENSSVNGWTESGDDDIASVPAGKKAKGNLYFSLGDAEVETLADFTDVEFSLRVYDDESWKDLIVTDPITLYADK